jgi:hypothetical protein
MIDDYQVADSEEFDATTMESEGIPWHIIKVAFEIIDGSYLALTPE